MTESEIDRQKADALYRYHTTAVRLNHTKQRIRDIADSLREVATFLDRENEAEQSEGIVRSGSLNRPLEDIADNTNGTANASVLLEAIRELREARNTAKAAHDEARRLGVDPKAIE